METLSQDTAEMRQIITEMERIQKQAHAHVEAMLDPKKPEITYQDCYNTFLLMKLAEMTVKMHLYGTDAAL